MATPDSGSFNSLTRRHGVKIDSAAGVEACSLAVGEVIGYENIVSASRMISAVKFVKTVDLANQLVQSDTLINGIFTCFPCLHLQKKVTLSNVPPFIPNEALIKLLAHYGKTISPLKMIQIPSTWYQVSTLETCVL